MPVTADSRGIERQVDPRADADLEHPVVAGDAHALDGLEPAGMQRGAEGEVVDLSELVVHAFDEIVLDSSNGEGTRASVRSGDEVFVVLGFTVE